MTGSNPIGAVTNVSSSRGERAATVWSILSRPLRVVLVGGIAVAAYGVYTWWLAVHAGLSPDQASVHAYGVSLPYLGPTATASALLALGTAALAYAAHLQSVASERLVVASEAQVLASREQTEILRLELLEKRERASQARSAALKEEAIRRAETFPWIRIVTPSMADASQWTTVIPGNAYSEIGEPRVGVVNQGKGRAVDVRTSVSWKVFDFTRAKQASGPELAAVKWERPPQFVLPVDFLDPGEVSWVDTSGWLSAFVVGSQLTKRIVAIYLRVSWTDPDSRRERLGGRGLQLVSGGFRSDPSGAGLEQVFFVAIGPEDAPPDDAFTREAPL